MTSLETGELNVKFGDARLDLIVAKAKEAPGSSVGKRTSEGGRMGEGGGVGRRGHAACVCNEGER